MVICYYKREFFANTQVYNTHLAVYSNATCIFRCVWRNLRKDGTNATFLKISTAKFIFPREVVRYILYIHSIDGLYPHARNIQWSPCAKSFRSFHTEFLLDDHDDPGLWSEREQSRTKTLPVFQLDFLACYIIHIQYIYRGCIVHVYRLNN